MRARWGITVAVLAVTAVFAPRRAVSQDQQSVRVEPPRVAVTMLYDGATVHVTAPVPPEAGVAMILRGVEGDLVLKRKGKVLGLIWMNVGDITFPGVPGVYLLQTSRPLVDLAHDTVLREAGVGFGALEGDDPAVTPALREELALLKARDRLWEVAEGTVAVEPAGETGAVSSADFFLPAKTPPGEYRVLVYAFQDGQALLMGEGRVQVAQAGVAAFITELAERHGLLYGILAVLVAGAAGLFTGVVFGIGGGKGH